MTLYEDSPEEIKLQIQFKNELKIIESIMFLKKNGYKIIKNN